MTKENPFTSQTYDFLPLRSRSNPHTVCCKTKKTQVRTPSRISKEETYSKRLHDFPRDLHFVWSQSHWVPHFLAGRISLHFSTHRRRLARFRVRVIWTHRVYLSKQYTIKGWTIKGNKKGALLTFTSTPFVGISSSYTYDPFRRILLSRE